jgi:hypothetical protein
MLQVSQPSKLLQDRDPKSFVLARRGGGGGEGQDLDLEEELKRNQIQRPHTYQSHFRRFAMTSNLNKTSHLRSFLTP